MSKSSVSAEHLMDTSGNTWHTNLHQGKEHFVPHMTVLDPSVPGTCAGCALLCGDVSWARTVSNSWQSSPRCELADTWFNAKRLTSVIVDGRPASLADAVSEIAKLLQASSMPTFYGYQHASNETIRAALALADRTGGFLDSATSTMHGASILAVQTVGKISCTLGEIRDRGDFVLYWGCDPASELPRLSERLTNPSPSTNSPWPAPPAKYQVVVDARETQSAQRANESIRLRTGSDLDALTVLRGLLAGISQNESDVQARTGVSLAIWHQLLDRMKSARYGAILFGSQLMREGLGALECTAIHTLARDLNQHTAFVCRAMPAAGNSIGSDSVHLWTTGFSHAINLQADGPRYQPTARAIPQLIAEQLTDLLVVIDGTIPASLDKLLPSSIPVIWISPTPPPDDISPRVIIHTAQVGLDSSGGMYRFDDVPLHVPARSVDVSLSKGPHRPTGAQVISMITQALTTA